MNITPLLHAKFVYGITTTEMFYSKLTGNFMDPISSLAESKLTGKRYLNNKMHKGSFTVFVHLFKEQNLVSKFENYIFYEGKEVYFYPWANGDPMQNEFGKPVLFKITNCNPFFFNTPEYQDIIVMTFESMENVQLSYKERFGYGVKYSTQYGQRL